MVSGVLSLAVLTSPPGALRSAAQEAATATPTPRVIRVGRPRGTPSPVASPRAVTATPTPWLEIEGESGSEVTPTPTPWLEIEDKTPVAALPTATATATPSPLPTSTPIPTPTPIPPTPTATPIPAPPTIAPANPGAVPTIAPVAATRIDFAAADWTGGFYRGDGLAYGRAWVAVYGAFSDYPRASLRFTLQTRPRGAATLTITGLDDEWAEPNEIALEVNGEPVYTGPGPFPNWDGVGDGRDAAWTPVAFQIPNGLLRAGENEIALANLEPVDSFNSPPYVLLSNAVLEISGSRRDGGSGG
jgi:hypothetical protein